MLLGLKNGNIIIRRCGDLEVFIVMDKMGYKHTGPVWSIIPITPNVVATGGEDGAVNIWRIDKLLFS